MLNNSRPSTTLFMLMSLDGKISTGDNDALDFDTNLKTITGVKEGLHQYYDLEQQTDLYSLNTGRVLSKIGLNTRNNVPAKSPVSFIVIDNKPHLNKNGISYLCRWSANLLLVTTNKNHVAFELQAKYDNLKILYYEKLDLGILLVDLKEKYQIEKLTIQSGGTLNSEFLRQNLIDFVHIVIAPILVGGKDTSTLIDGSSITNIGELVNLKPLKLEACHVLEKSYLQLNYKVFKT